MKKGDYSTLQKAFLYNNKRFSGGKKQIARDEALILNHLLSKNTPGSKIYLDFGTGTGRAIREILKHNPKKIYALDESVQMLATLRNNFPVEITSNKIQTIKTKIENIEMKGASVDTVTALHVLKHIKDTKKVFIRVHHVLKPKGYFIFEVLNSHSIVRFNLDTCYASNIKDIDKQLKQAGFNIIKTKQIHIFGETIYHLLWPFSGWLGKLDAMLTRLLPFGTKIFILAQKI